MVRNIHNLPEILLGQGEYKHAVYLDDDSIDITPDEIETLMSAYGCGTDDMDPPEPEHVAADFADLATEWYEQGRTDAAVIERRRTRWAFVAAVVVCLGLGGLLGFSVGTNVGASVVEVGE